MRAMRWLFVIAMCAPFMAGAQQTLPDSTLEIRTTEVASTLRCPVCQGESIQDSPADLAKQMRLLVKDMLREGKTPDEIQAYFVGRYGEWILLEPKLTGFNIVLYVLPVVVLIGGAVFVLRFVKRSSSGTESNGQVLQ